ncbi:MAG TPA: type II toxin-antitoxin system PemK/MazF family toxin [Gemmatimonadaceae bacterium]|nr:type II toxin-antitoxin system PemK/MazF family toxin [Gemmatimonadaceae bacterium]
MRLSRGDLFLVSPPPGDDPRRARAVVVVSRQTLCDSRADKVVCAPVNTNSDGRSTEVHVGQDEGLKHDSVINCDQLILVRKSVLTNYLGSISAKKKAALNAALRIALDI